MSLNPYAEHILSLQNQMHPNQGAPPAATPTAASTSSTIPGSPATTTATVATALSATTNNTTTNQIYPSQDSTPEASSAATSMIDLTNPAAAATTTTATTQAATASSSSGGLYAKQSHRHSNTHHNNNRRRKNKSDMSDIETESDSDMDSDLDQRPTRILDPHIRLDPASQPISRLPTEIISHIFKFLPDKHDRYNTLYVCKFWFSISVDSFWFRPNILKPETLDMITKVLGPECYPTLTVPYHHMIRRLNLTSVPDHVTDEILSTFTICKNLERLTLISCSKLTDASLVPLLSSCKNLLSVDMSNLELVTDKTIFALATNCLKLQGLYASNCKLITDESIKALVASCKSLKRMKLTSCNKLTDASIQPLIQSSPSLVELDLAGVSEISNETATMALTMLPQLREFRLAMNPSISDQAVLSIDNPSFLMDKLRIIDFANCSMITDDLIERLIGIAPRLRHIVLARCSNVTDRSLQFIAKLGRNLHYLHLGHCSNITNRGISEVVKNCMRIEYIDTSSCTQLTDAAVKDLAALPKLRRVGLVKCQQITDVAIHAFAHRTGADNTLERVHLSYCSNITLNSITRLVNACPRLTHLSLSGVPAFLRDDLTRFCRQPPSNFSQHQQAIFCVFSSKGVTQLRDHLNRLASQQQNFEYETFINRGLVAQAMPGIMIPGVMPVEQPQPHTRLTTAAADALARNGMGAVEEILGGVLGFNVEETDDDTITGAIPVPAAATANHENEMTQTVVLPDENGRIRLVLNDSVMRRIGREEMLQLARTRGPADAENMAALFRQLDASPETEELTAEETQRREQMMIRERYINSLNAQRNNNINNPGRDFVEEFGFRGIPQGFVPGQFARREDNGERGAANNTADAAAATTVMTALTAAAAARQPTGEIPRSIPQQQQQQQQFENVVGPVIGVTHNGNAGFGGVGTLGGIGNIINGPGTGGSGMNGTRPAGPGARVVQPVATAGYEDEDDDEDEDEMDEDEDAVMIDGA